MDGHTYRYYKGTPLYPFGYGLSYTMFEYSGLSVQPANITKGQTLMVSAMVKNTGMYDSDEVSWNHSYCHWDRMLSFFVF